MSNETKIKQTNVDKRDGVREKLKQTKKIYVNH